MTLLFEKYQNEVKPDFSSLYGMNGRRISHVLHFQFICTHICDFPLELYYVVYIRGVSIYRCMFEVENKINTYSNVSKLFIPFDRYTYFEIQFRPVWSRFCIVYSCTRVKIMHLAVYSWRDTMKNNRKTTIKKNKKNSTNLIKPKGSKKGKREKNINNSQ